MKSYACYITETELKVRELEEGEEASFLDTVIRACNIEQAVRKFLEYEGP